MQFQQFLKRLPSMEEPLNATYPQGDAFEPKPQPIPGYVPPTITAVDWPDQASVILIEAAGAVGKSAAARAIAHQLNWPLVRAEKAQVGSYSLSGLIQDALGFSSRYIADLAAGESGVVVDSLDEAHFRAGTENFLAFLDNVSKVSGAGNDPAGRRPSIVLMSRTDTAELVNMAFLDAGLPLAHVQLDFFDTDGAQRFIRTYMALRYSETKRGEYNLPLASPVPFERLRDGMFTQIAAVLLQDDEVDLRRNWAAVRDFVGYTPVLIAMAEALAVGNPAAERASLTSSDQSNLLREIIEHISDREQRKFSQHILSKLHAALPADDPEIEGTCIYRIDEQCARLMAHVNRDDVTMHLPAELPESVRPTYEEAVGTFLLDHPFLKGRGFASVVFADYVTSAACRSIKIRASLARAPEQLIDGTGPFFARFLADDARENSLDIKEALIEHVVESWTQESDLVRAADSGVVISLADGTGLLTCTRESNPNHLEPPELEFTVSDMSGAFYVRRPLKRTTLITDQAVIVGETRKQLMLGPVVIILADEIVIEADVLRIDTDRGRSEGVMLASESITANYLGKIESGPSDLHVFSSDPPARLRPHMRRLGAGPSVISFQRYIDLRTILTSFRPSTKSSRALQVLAAKIDRKIVKGNEHRIKILERLIDVGAVSRDNSWYYLDLATLGQQGFNLQDLKSGEPGDAALRFLHSCSDAH